MDKYHLHSKRSCDDLHLQDPLGHVLQMKSCPILEFPTQIHISKMHQWHSKFQFELRGRKTAHGNGIQALQRIITTLFCPFDR